MEHNEVDVTHTIKASEANGRTLVKNVDTGKTRWLGQAIVACDDEEHDLPSKPVDVPLDPVDAPVLTKAQQKFLAEKWKTPHLQD